jgi:hypothetical protein
MRFVLLDESGECAEMIGRVISMHDTLQEATKAEADYKAFAFSVSIVPKTRVLTVKTALGAGDPVTIDLVT